VRGVRAAALLPLAQVRKQLKEAVGTVDHNLVASCLSLLDALLRPYARGEGERQEPLCPACPTTPEACAFGKPPRSAACRPAGMPELSSEEAQQLARALPSLVLFALTWSLGASCNSAGRPLFDAFLREQVSLGRCLQNALHH
jgi:dynein heavy chain